MVLVDTSVWVAFLRQGHSHLQTLLREAEVVCHPFVIGELSLGGIKDRDSFLELLSDLPQGPLVDPPEVLRFIESRRLMRVGIGLVDVFLLASCLLADTPLWTLDRRLKSAAVRLGVIYRP